MIRLNEVDLVRGQRAAGQELAKRLGRRFPVKSDQRAGEQPEPVGRATGLVDVLGTAPAGRQHPLQFVKVRWRELLVTAQLLQRQVVLVGAQVHAGLGAEPLEVRADLDVVQRDDGSRPARQ